MNNTGNILRKPLFLFITLFFVVNSYAEEGSENKIMPQYGERDMSPPSQSGHERRGVKAPPKSAIDACVGKNAGDACECKGPRGNEAGVCEYTPDKKYFACRPSSMKPRNKQPGERQQNPRQN